jgi:succinoglycan biosynthesis transport protein ExoP
MQNQDGVELRWIFAVLRRWWWVIAVCAVITTAIATAFFFSSSPFYEATATLLIRPAQDASTSEVNILVAGERLALTYSQMLKSSPVLHSVIDEEGLEMTPNELASKITSVPVADTQLMRLTVRDTSADQAAILANAIARAFTSFIQEINSGRYAATLTSLQEQMDELDTLIQNTQSTMNDNRASMIETQAELTIKENNLNEYRNEYQGLQQDYQDLQLIVSQLKENVNVIEAAHATPSDSGSFHTASVTLFLTDEALASTYNRILTGKPVLEETIALLGLTESPDELIKWITVESLFGTHLIQLNVKNVGESQAILIADTLASVFIDQIQQLVVEPYANNLTTLSTQLEELSAKIERTQLDIESLTLENIQSETELGRLEVILGENRNDYRLLQQNNDQLRLTASDEAEAVVLAESAQIPTDPIQRGRLYIIVAAAVGVLLGIGLAVFLEYLDDTIKTPQDINKSLGLSTLGSIPKMTDGENELAVVEQPRSPTAESYRLLGTNLRFSSPDKPLRTLLVTSPEPKEGKSVIVANLGAAIAMLGTKVIIVDADLRRPRQHVLFGLRSGDGLTDALLRGTSNDMLQPTMMDNLSVLTSGSKLPPNPTELLSSQSMKKLLEELIIEDGLILVDSPPVLNLADTTALSPLVDGVLIVLEAGNTRSANAQQALANLQYVNANLIGAVLNSLPKPSMSAYYYYEEEALHAGNEVGKRKTRQSEELSAARRWFQFQKILPSIQGWINNKEIMPSIREWFQSKR